MDNWYSQLIEECQAIVIEGEFSANWIKVETYHELGKRILDEINRVEDVGVDKFLNGVAKDINRSVRTVYDAYRFAKKYPDLQLLPIGKNVT